MENIKSELELVPFKNRVFIKRDETKETTTGGVYIPENDREKSCAGIVIAAGPDCTTMFSGQRVIWGMHSGLEVVINGELITMIREEEIYAGQKKDTTAELMEIAKANHGVV